MSIGDALGLAKRLEGAWHDVKGTAGQLAEDGYKLATDLWNSAVNDAKAGANFIDTAGTNTAQAVAGTAAATAATTKPPAGVDWGFITAREGARTHGYVPPDSNGNPDANSGVTIAIGFDLGGRTVADLKKLGLPDDLVTKLTPYLGKRGQDAQNYLNSHPLTITQKQMQQIDTPAFTSYYNQVARNYNEAQTTGTRFQNLPKDVQTAIVDVAYQYGTNLAGATPNFWKQVTTGHWQQARDNLMNFGDAYPTRRRLEAGLINNAIKAGNLPVPAA